MQIEHLETFHFRNLAPLSLDLSGGVVVLEGPNAQGKTNLLEALFVCATGKSFRKARPREILAHHAQKGHVKARLRRQGVRHEVEVSLWPTRRTVKVDDRGLKRASRLLELINVVAFFPDDLRIVKGSPEERRMFLDRAVANARPEFVDATLAYHKALKARNSLLRHDRVDRTLIEVYDEQLVQHGTILQRCRQDTLQELTPAAVERFGHMMPAPKALELDLDPGLGENVPYSPEAFAQALRESYPRDRKRGLTHRGPHRGDLLVSIGGQPARQFASQGQQRTAVLSLKLAEVAVLTKRLGCAPILLLDDVSSELDEARTAMLFELVSALESQVWISTTGAAPLPLPSTAQRWRVQAGEVTPFTPIASGA